MNAYRSSFQRKLESSLFFPFAWEQELDSSLRWNDGKGGPRT